MLTGDNPPKLLVASFHEKLSHPLQPVTWATATQMKPKMTFHAETVTLLHPKREDGSNAANPSDCSRLSPSTLLFVDCRGADRR